MKSTTMICELCSFFRMASPFPRQLSLILAIWCVAAAARAQTIPEGQISGSRAMSSSAAPMALPDSPTPASLMGLSDTPASSTVQNVGSGLQYPPRAVRTSHLDNLIDPQEVAPKLSVSDKVGMGLKASVSPFAVIGWIGSATYSETFNRSPNYGQSAKNYAQRLGAAAARASSEGIFSTSVMAPILHEDPRYFAEGPGHSGFRRTGYALSRVLFTKTDDGRSTINYALLSGNAIGAGLTQTYYPAGNRNFHGTVTTFGISLAGSGVKYLFEEFFYKQASIAQLKSRF